MSGRAKQKITSSKGTHPTDLVDTHTSGSESLQCHVLLIDDNILDAKLTQYTLASHGISVTYAKTLLEAEQCAQHLLRSGPTTVVPPVVLLDLKVPDPCHPSLEGSVLAASLRRKTQEGLLVPTWLVALTSDLTVEREEEARYAGCDHVLLKPLTDAQAQWLIELAKSPPTVQSNQDLGVRLFQDNALQLLATLRRAQLPYRWSTADLELMLSGVSHFPISMPPDEARRAAVLSLVGGHDGARKLLSQTAATLDDPYQSILKGLLANQEPRRIIRALRYNRSYVWSCMHRLPERLAKVLE